MPKGSTKKISHPTRKLNYLKLETGASTNFQEKTEDILLRMRDTLLEMRDRLPETRNTLPRMSDMLP